MNVDSRSLSKVDIEVYNSIKKEEQRQNDHIELIASENFVSKAVLEAMGSCLTNKYAEGYPNARYYNGCENIDEIESLAIERAKVLFNAEHANVQPHSGSNANLAVFLACLNAGDTFMGMSLTAGGHLSHGAPFNVSGKIFNCVPYGLNAETELLDYDEIERLALKHKPKLIVAGGSAYSRFIDFKRFREIADKVNAKLMVDMAHIAGLVAAGVHPSPIPYADFVTTTTHKTLRGPRGGMILCKKEYAKIIDKAVFPCLQGGPLEHVIAAKAVMLKEAFSPEFKEYQKQVVKNAKVLGDELLKYGFKLVSGGTDNHLLLVDLTPFNANGRDVANLLHKANITCNKNGIPNEKQPLSITSGIRLGTPAVTTRGMKEEEMKQIASFIYELVKNGESSVDTVKAKVLNLVNKF
ncbi:MAG TPA: serine hydroxymethyltransferase [Candidatus Caccopulliclostridium gallistercoris]|uniref:Serine hydroxymethyltransferase n=1 Tax=Candidatus Caccopulliclostridium gallistercoris TaxID=2840719 RepID=A0A9D1NEK6_9FIRM|nr:serine hydroxymethyltransferase [Candidatus Caccopulliclostridium gallistercoris]